LRLLHACDQWHSSWAFTPLTGWHCKFRRNSEGVAKHYKVTQTVLGSDIVLVLTGCADQTFRDLKEIVEYYSAASKGRSHPLDKFTVEQMDKVRL
jgi:hypothetical protein